MSQIDKVRNKLLLQANRVLKKFKPTTSREISNSELMISLYQYAVSKDIPNEYGDKMEWLHERLVKLNETQMEMIRLRFWEGMSYRQIGDKVGHNQMYVLRKIAEALNVLRQE